MTNKLASDLLQLLYDYKYDVEKKNEFINK